MPHKQSENREMLVKYVVSGDRWQPHYKYVPDIPKNEYMRVFSG